MKALQNSNSQTSLTPERRFINILAAGGLLTGFLILFLVPPANFPFSGCAFYSLTGHSCMTCGMTRSLHALLHGDLSASFRYHLFGPLVLTAMLLGFLILAAEAAGGKRLAFQINRRMRNSGLILFAAVWILYWGARLVMEFLV